MSSALLIIDIQNDYFPAGSMELVGSIEAAQKAARLLHVFRERGLPIVHIQHISMRPGATFFLPGAAGAEIHQSVAPASGETVFQKHYPNSFRDTPLLAHLKHNNIQQLVIAGMMTHMCVDTTVRAAADLGLQCLLAHDACATRALTFGDATVPAENVHAAFIASLSGTFAKVQSTDELRTLRY